MTPATIRLAVFDMAGTTIDDRDEVYRVLRAAVEREGASFSDAEFQQWMGTEKRHAIANLLRIGGVETGMETGADSGADSPDEVVNRAFAWFIDELRRTYTAHPPTPLPGVEDALMGLRDRGIAVGLTTGFSRQIVDIILTGMGWTAGDIVDVVVAGDEVPNGRPAPDMILAVMDAAGVTDPAEVISVGDTVVDVDSALAAGVTSVGVLTGHLVAADFDAAGAHHVLDSVADVATLPEIAEHAG